MSGHKAQKLNFVDEVIKPGVKRADWHGGPFTAVRYTYEPGAVFPSHSHEAAQITIVLAGQIKFSVDNVEFSLDSGESIYIPGNVSHGAEVPSESEPVVSINIFHPPRKEHP